MAPIDPKALIARAETISKEFEYGTEDVRKGVKEFLRLMGGCYCVRGILGENILTIAGVSRRWPSERWRGDDHDSHIRH
jgi:hypothetical protein